MKTLILAGVSAIALTLGGAHLGYAAGMNHESNSSSMSSSSHMNKQAKASQSEVKQAQQELKSKGLYNGQVDGVLGPETKQALEQFQQKQGLQQTGTLDEKTMAALTGGQTSGAGSSTPPSSGSSSEETNGSNGNMPSHSRSMNSGSSGSTSSGGSNNMKSGTSNK